MNDLHETRRKNTRYLIDIAGGVTAFSSKIGKSQTQVSSLVGPRSTKNIGEKIARQIELAFFKPVCWLDIDHDTTVNISQKTSEQTLVKDLSLEAIKHAKIFDQLPPDKQKLLTDTAKAFLIPKNESGQ